MNSHALSNSIGTSKEIEINWKEIFVKIVFNLAVMNTLSHSFQSIIKLGDCIVTANLGKTENTQA